MRASELPAVKAESAVHLTFSDEESPELLVARFSHPLCGGERAVVRGKTAGVSPHSGTFQWTRGVQGLCLLLVRSAAALPDTYVLRGGQRSAALSLDYAIDKQPEWVAGLFGLDARGYPLIRRLITRSNASMRRAAPVELSLNRHFIDPSSIRISCGGRDIRGRDALEQFAMRLSGEAPRISGNQGEHSALLRSEPVDPATLLNEFEPHFISEVRRALTTTLVSTNPGDRARVLSAEEERTLPERLGTIRLALPAALGASVVLFSYMRSSLGYDIAMDFRYPHSSGIEQALVAGKVGPVDVVAMSIGPATAVMATRDEHCQFLTHLPRQQIGVVARTDEVDAPKDHTCQTAVLGGEHSTELHLLRALEQHGHFRGKAVNPEHIEPHEIRAALTATSPTRAILGFPYYHFALTTVPEVTRLHSIPHEIESRECYLVSVPGGEMYGVRAELLKQAVRDAWLRLIEEPETLDAACRQVMSDREYRRVLWRFAGATQL